MRDYVIRNKSKKKDGKHTIVKRGAELYTDHYSMLAQILNIESNAVKSS